MRAFGRPTPINHVERAVLLLLVRAAVRGLSRHHRAQHRACGAVPGAGLRHRVLRLDAAARRVPGHRAGAGLRRRGDGAVPVRGDDARRRCRRGAPGLLEALPAGGLRRRADRAGDGAGADGRLPPYRGAAARPDGTEAGQQQGAGHRDLHPLPVPAAGGRGAAAGGHHRRHRADAAPAQGQPPHGPGQQVRAKKADRLRLVPMRPTIELPSAPKSEGKDA